MKKIMVCCGSSMITSTMAINKLKQGKVKEERPDVIVPTGVLKDTLTDDVPVVVGTCFVTGVGEKATIDKILEILSK